MIFMLLTAYLAIAVFFTFMAMLQRRPETSGLRLFLAIVAWPVSVLIVLVAVARVITIPTGTDERHYSRV